VLADEPGDGREPLLDDIARGGVGQRPRFVVGRSRLLCSEVRRRAGPIRPAAGTVVFLDALTLNKSEAQFVGFF
jgi:hypothetical protein